jgi:hypothetical protein
VELGPHGTRALCLSLQDVSEGIGITSAHISMAQIQHSARAFQLLNCFEAPLSQCSHQEVLIHGHTIIISSIALTKRGNSRS